MKLTQLTQQEELLLQLYEKRGGVINFVVIDLEDDCGDDYDTHWESAVLALDKVAQDTDDYFQTLLERSENQQYQREDFFQITYDVGQLVAEAIHLEHFLGPWFDVGSRRLLMRGQSKLHMNNLFWFGDEEIPENVVGECGASAPESFGLANAFLSPPHGMRGSHLELNTLFLDIVDHFFAAFTDAGQIYTWSDDCSNYFDAGKEWWGTLFCTYFCKPHSTIVAVLASTTD